MERHQSRETDDSSPAELPFDYLANSLAKLLETAKHERSEGIASQNIVLLRYSVMIGICSVSCSLRSRIEPDRHAGLEAGRITLQVEAQAQGIAVVIANRALGLPSRERAQRAQLGDQSWRLLRRA